MNSPTESSTIASLRTRLELVRQRLPEWKLRLITPGESTLVLVIAAIVGVFAGLATGLFANAINFFHLLFFRTSTFAQVFSLGEAGKAWRAGFVEELARTRWHLEFLVVGGAAIGAALILDRIARLESNVPHEKVPGGDRPFFTIAELIAVGLGLFYPLALLAAFNRSFPQTTVGLATIVEQAPWYVVIAIPAIGGLAVGLLVHRLTAEARGHGGVGGVIEAVAVRGGRIPASVAIWKSLTAAISIGSGGSVGREGPVVQIGSAVGSAIGQKMEVSRSNLLVLVGAGAAAGIAGSFDAPIAGAMFAVEIILLEFGVRTFTPIVLAAVTAVIVSKSLIGGVQEIVRPSYELVSGLEIFAYAVLGVVAGAASLFYVKGLMQGEDVFAGRKGGRVGAWLSRLPAPVKPAVGGLLLGMLGLVLPRALGTGYETMNAALLGELGFGVLVAMAFAKVVATALTLGSGGSGGSFFPSMVLGAMVGGAFGTIVHAIFPAHTAVPGAYALVGMGAVVAGSTLAPLTGIVMLFELTGNYEIILPLMVTCVIASTMVHRIQGESIYTLRLAARGISVRTHREQVVLRSIPVDQAMTREMSTVQESMPLDDLLERIRSTSHSTFPVLNEEEELVGMVTVLDVRTLLYQEDPSGQVLVRDLARPPAATLEPGDDLEQALQKIVAADVDILPVVDAEDSRRLVGLLSRRDVLRAWGAAIAKKAGRTEGPTTS